MTITDKEFIKWVCEKAGRIQDFCELWLDCRCYQNECLNCMEIENIKLDYNICMKAVENININSGHVDNIGLYISLGRCSFSIYTYSWDSHIDDFLEKVFTWREYDGQLLALQHTLKYIMENER